MPNFDYYFRSKFGFRIEEQSINESKLKKMEKRRPHEPVTATKTRIMWQNGGWRHNKTWQKTIIATTDGHSATKLILTFFYT